MWTTTSGTTRLPLLFDAPFEKLLLGEKGRRKLGFILGIRDVGSTSTFSIGAADNEVADLTLLIRALVMVPLVFIVVAFYYY